MLYGIDGVLPSGRVPHAPFAAPAARCIVRRVQLWERVEPMSRTDQPDFFETESQPDLFGEEPPRAYRPDPDKVRARLYRILAEARAARTLPWDSTRTSLYRTIFPQMTLWLPDEEAAQLRFEFETELERLQAA